MKKTLPYSDIDSIIFSGGGIESAAALAWAHRKKLNPLVVTFVFSDTEAVKQMVIATQKQAEYFGFNCHVSVSDTPISGPITYNVSDVCLGFPIEFVLGNPKLNIKYFITGTNSEDSLQQRVQIRHAQRTILARRTKQYELCGNKIADTAYIPVWVFPFEYLTKAEIIGMVANSYPELMKMVWTCHNPIEDKPCKKCSKCIEYRAANDSAWRASKRVQEGDNYGLYLRN